jgi:hypothetical protein
MTMKEMGPIARKIIAAGSKHRRQSVLDLATVRQQERFWLEYVFEAYASDRPDAVFLMGLPDVAESRPHSKINWDLEVGVTG